jgi:hypothetical protein
MWYFVEKKNVAKQGVVKLWQKRVCLSHKRIERIGMQDRSCILILLAGVNCRCHREGPCLSDEFPSTQRLSDIDAGYLLLINGSIPAADNTSP